MKPTVNTIATWLINNWFLIIVVIAAVYAVVAAVKKFASMPTDDQIKKVKACLLNWVILAEKELGGGTGRVKLSMVYSKFVEAFPFISMLVPFEVFSGWVDEALKTMDDMLRSNVNIMNYIGVNTVETQEDVKLDS